MLALLLACAPGDPADDDTAPPVDTSADTDTAADSDTDTDSGVDPSQFHGTVPDEALPAPEFTARNYDETVRDRDDLVGHPSLLWFYPAAQTGG